LTLQHLQTPQTPQPGPVVEDNVLPRDARPALAADLMDGDRVVGWASGRTVGFRGFADEHEAVHAAWVAYRTLARRVARREGTRPIPVDTVPLRLVWRDGREVILASGRMIGTLVRPGAKSRSGAHSFGFEVEVPAPADELMVRAKAHLMYRTLRRSGIRWGMWRPGVEFPAEQAA
jgi:hypothetical protein